MVAIAQLVEHRIVIPGVAGSSPVGHPIQVCPELIERLVQGLFFNNNKHMNSIG